MMGTERASYGDRERKAYWTNFCRPQGGNADGACGYAASDVPLEAA